MSKKCNIDSQEINNTDNFIGKDFTNCGFFIGKEIDIKQFTSCIFKGVNLQNTKMNDVNFTKCNLEQVDLTGADLYQCKWENNSKCMDMDFIDTKINDCEFLNNKMDQSNLQDTVGSNIKISDCSLIGSNFSDTQFTNLNVENTNFAKSHFVRAEITDSAFNNCDFSESVLTQSKFIKCTFIHSVFDNTIWGVEGSENPNAIFTDCSFGNTTFIESDLIKVEFINAYLRGIEFYGSNLEGANLEGANLTDAGLTDTNLEGANLTGANLTGANLKKSYLNEANLNKANLTNALLGSARLIDADLINTNLTGANLKDANLTNANLTDANLTNANLNGVDLTGTNLTGAKNVKLTGHNNKKLSPLQLSPSFKQISKNKTAFDVIDGEVEMVEFLKLNLNSIAFFIQNHYYLIDKTELSRMISPTNKLKNSIVYECLVAGTHDNPRMNRENMNLDNPLMKLSSIGVPMTYAYIPIKYIQTVINTSRMVNDRIYEIVNTQVEVNSVVSYQILHNLTGWVSGSHCQEGQGGKIYKLQKIKNAGKIVSDAIKRNATQHKYNNKSSSKRKTKKITSKTKTKSK